MPDTSKLFLQHPAGDTQTLPCTHLVQQHPGGHKEYVPCKHPRVRQHTEDTVRGISVPCVHWVSPHPAGDEVTVPCAHLVLEHPEGHAGPTVPCIHPMPVLRAEFGGSLLFYTDDAVVQDCVMSAVSRFNQLGVNLLSARPLHVFHRPPLGDGGGDDPFWSHYNPTLHVLQILDDGRSEEATRDTIRHELGHAIIGNQITNHYAGGSHTMLDPAETYALAMSEGWAHFVALALAHDRGTKTLSYKGRSWEDLTAMANGKVEYCVAACLWDLFDTAGSTPVRMGRRTLERVVPDDESARLAFTELFRVYSPTLETLTLGPWVSSIWDFLDRVKANNPDVSAAVDEARDRNVGARPADA